MLQINLIVANKLIGVGSYSFPEPMSSDVCLSDQGTKTKKRKKTHFATTKEDKISKFLHWQNRIPVAVCLKKKRLAFNMQF